jgi:hypothetical protein
MLITSLLHRHKNHSILVHQLFTDCKKAYDSVSKGVLYNILVEFSVPIKPVRLIKMCFNETCSKVRVGNYLSNTFRIQNTRSLNKEMLYHHITIQHKYHNEKHRSSN